MAESLVDHDRREVYCLLMEYFRSSFDFAVAREEAVSRDNGGVEYEYESIRRGRLICAPSAPTRVQTLSCAPCPSLPRFSVSELIGIR